MPQLSRKPANCSPAAGYASPPRSSTWPTEFNDQLLRTTPEKAAQVILRGVQRDSRRILIGTDAHAIDVMLRLAPVLYQRLVTASMRLAARFAPRPKSPQGAREASE